MVSEISILLTKIAFEVHGDYGDDKAGRDKVTVIPNRLEVIPWPHPYLLNLILKEVYTESV